MKSAIFKLVFKKAQSVKFVIPTRAKKPTRGSGVIIALPPRGAEAGAFRLTVRDKDGKRWHPYPSQCRTI